MKMLFLNKIPSVMGKLYCPGISAIVTRVAVRWLSAHSSTATGKEAMEQAKSDDIVLAKDVGDCGVIVLNRPNALNSLNTLMVEKIYSTLKQWESSKRLVIIEGAGGKAFCAGGDVKTIIMKLKENEKAGITWGTNFFRKEYTLNHFISAYKKPYIALINGITMGGGVGLSVHGRYRVATEKTIFAMPETAIGLFPDVGGTYFLPRLKGKLGLYLGLTGHRLKGVDVLLAGIATHFVPSDKIPDLKRDLLTSSAGINVEDILNRYQPNLNHEFSLAPHMSQIENCFSAPTVEEIVERLKKDKSEWAQKNVKILIDTVSPSSLKVSKKAIDEGREKSLAECLRIEYRLVHSALSKDSDFYEGVRALLIDKDQKPMWKPSTLANVTDEYINRQFMKLPEDKELQLYESKL